MFDVNLRLNKPLEIGSKKYDVNESVLSFSTIEIAQINEHKDIVSARGGYHNNPLVDWEVDHQVSFAITHGVLSPLSYSLLSNSIMKEPKFKSISYYEELHTIEDNAYCYVDLKYCPNSCQCKIGAQPNPYNEPLPMGRRPELLLKPLPPSKTKWIFIYDKETGQKIKDFGIFNNRIFFKERYRNVIVDYTFYYQDRIKVIEVGNRLFNGYMRLDGKMSVKNQITGEITTAIVDFPKVKISSSLSMNLGKSYDNSTVSDFYFIAYPNEEKDREEREIMNISFLNSELSEDYI